MTQEEKNQIKALRKLRKMNREKQKRSKLNDQFDHLCNMLQMGKATRVEKLAVLNQTIRVVCQLKEENIRLKQQRAQMKELLQSQNRSESLVQASEPTAVPPQDKMALPAEMWSCKDQEMYQQQHEELWTLPPSRHDDLDFAFGWLATQQQKMTLDSFAESDFKPCLLPKPDALDGVDMFLASSDDPSDLLC